KESWVTYWLNAPRELRSGQRLYLAMLRNKFPSLFKMPSKHYYGATAIGAPKYHINRFRHRLLSKVYRSFPKLGVKSNMMLNYLDFNAMFRERNDYKEVLEIAVVLLEKNDICPWLDIRKIMLDHKKYRGDY